MKLVTDVTKTRLLPWVVMEPHEGCNCDEPEHNHMQYSVWDDEGNLVCECDGEDEGRSEAIAICAAVNRTGPAVCHCCGATATCFGAYETGLEPKYACNECCGHGCEDGHCERVGSIDMVDAAERAGRLADKAANFEAASKLRLPPAMHAQQLSAGMSELKLELRDLTREMSGENPWEGEPL